MSFVRIEELRVRYGALEAVKGISFSVRRGSRPGFAGLAPG